MLRKVLIASLVFGALVGSSSAANPQSGFVAPTNTSLPLISGPAVVGSTLSGSTGSWSGKGLSYSYRWLRCASGCAPIAGASARTHLVDSADAGLTLRFQVTASNKSGSAVAASDPTAPVSAPIADTQAPSAPGSLTLTGTTSSSVSVAWSASSDDLGVSGYDVYDNGAKVSTTTGLSATVSGLACAGSHTIAVDAYDAAGNVSALSTVSATTSACPLAPAPTHSIYWGAFTEGRDTYSYLYGGTWSNGPWCDPGTGCPLAKFTSNVGKTPSIEHWGMCWTCNFDGTAALVRSRGNIPAVDWANNSSAPDADIAAGKFDAYITSQAQAMKAYASPIFLLWDEEMNGTWYPYSPGQGGNTAQSFVAAWRHIHDVFEAVGATNVTWVWCPNVDTNGITPTWSSMASVYPGDAYVDWTGLNGYNWGAAAGPWQSFDQVFSTSYAMLQQIAPSKPIMLGEVASEEAGGNKAAWITDALGTQLPQRYPQIKAVLWFNWRIFEKNAYWSWEVESSPASQAAFATSIASPYYAPGGTFANLPPLTKIQPLP